VGCCVGLRGIRIQNLVNELNGEKIDIVEWNPDPKVFIANALNPAQVTSVVINEDENTATVVVPDRLLSLAIGKEGQNARLAAKLTGWRIDIESASAAEAEKALAEEKARDEQPIAEAPVEEALIEQPEAPAAELEEPLPLELAEPDTEAEAIGEHVESLAPEEEELLPVEAVEPIEEVVAEASPIPQLRFAEDIFPTKVTKPGKKAKKAKGKGKAKEEDVVKPKKVRRTPVPKDEVDEYADLLD
jgi:N utilization substance protein A